MGTVGTPATDALIAAATTNVAAQAKAYRDRVAAAASPKTKKIKAAQESDASQSGDFVAAEAPQSNMLKYAIGAAVVLVAIVGAVAVIRKRGR